MIGRADVDGAGAFLAEVDGPGLGLIFLGADLARDGDDGRGVVESELGGSVVDAGLLVLVGLANGVDDLVDVEVVHLDGGAVGLVAPLVLVWTNSYSLLFLESLGSLLHGHGLDLDLVGGGRLGMKSGFGEDGAFVGEHQAEEPQHAEKEAEQQGSTAKAHG